MVETKVNRIGYFGEYGGKFLPETLMEAVLQLEGIYEEIKEDEQFQQELAYYLEHYVGRKTPLYRANRLSKEIGGATIYLKREDLNHTGAHKINNTLGQGLLTKRLGKKKVVAETGAGQHGVATATVCALLDLECIIFMGEEDIRRQKANVDRMRLLGAKVVAVTSGSRTLKDAVNEALKYWVTNVRDTHYILGSAMGPHPFPTIVRDFQSVIGKETKTQCLEQIGHLPEHIVACIGGGSNAIGMFHPFIQEKVALYGVEAAGKGLETDKHAATLTKGKPGILHGAKMYVLQDEYGQIQEAHSISAGLDYPGIGPEHCYLHDLGRVRYESVTDEEAVAAFHLLAKTEGILPALESSHGLAYAKKLAEQINPEEYIVVCLSGRGDKDLKTVMECGV